MWYVVCLVSESNRRCRVFTLRDGDIDILRISVLSETSSQGLQDVAVRRRVPSPMRRPGNVRRRGHIYVAERRRGYVPVSRNWVFHLRPCGDVLQT